MATYFAEQQDLTPAVVAQVRAMVEFWHAQMYPNLSPCYVEQSFEIVRNGVTFTGRIDLGDLSGITVDHKFSYDLWNESRAKNSVQPIIYQWAHEDLFGPQHGVKYKGFEYHIGRTFPTTAIQVLRVGRVNEEKSKWYEAHIREIAEAMVAGVFFARPDDKQCGKCDFKSRCKPTLYRVKAGMIGEIDEDLM